MDNATGLLGQGNLLYICINYSAIITLFFTGLFKRNVYGSACVDEDMYCECMCQCLCFCVCDAGISFWNWNKRQNERIFLQLCRKILVHRDWARKVLKAWKGRKTIEFPPSVREFIFNPHCRFEPWVFVSSDNQCFCLGRFQNEKLRQITVSTPRNRRQESIFNSSSFCSSCCFVSLIHFRCC